ncbi:MAG: putative sugar kinase [Methanomassiliicoccales archaeon PtaU1.Bin124]|nr:MAG: putative sugar kinase [Methanomassiliicoccales archaeon PtaU1.Bin124]
MAMRDALGVGALNLDLIYQVDDLNLGGMRLRPGGEIAADDERFTALMDDVLARGRLLGRSGGGSAANAITAMARMGMRTGFIGTVGADEEGEFLLKEMAGTDLKGVAMKGRSGVCLSLLAGNDRSLVVRPNANDMLTIGPAEIELANTYHAVHMSSFSGDAALKAQIALTEALVDEVMMSFDPGMKYVSRGLEQILPLVRRTDVLFVGERELAKLTGMGGEEGAFRIIELGPDIVVLKKGAEGSVIFADGERHPIPAVSANVVDTTGAGDVFAGAFITGLLKRWGLKTSARFASEAAARSVEAPGRERYPDRGSLAEFSRRRGEKA